MKLIWKVLKQNISVGQLIGFGIANTIGLTIILVGLQLFLDIQPILLGKSGFFKPDYMVLTKPVSALNSITNASPVFTGEEIQDIQSQEFISKIGVFTPARYSVTGRLLIERFGVDLVSELFFESVPEDFVDVESEDWSFEPGDDLVPIIIPYTYLNLYNFGYAPSSGFPTVSESMIRKITLNLALTGNGERIYFNGKIVGFSSRLNTILVPESFMQWSNGLLAHETISHQVSRIIVQVTNPADERIVAYFQEKGYNVESDKLDSAKINWLMRILVAIALAIGLLICVLATYILILSIFLLIQRNKTTIANLFAIGYRPREIAKPYQVIAILTNVFSIIVAILVVLVVRKEYVEYLLKLDVAYQPHSLVCLWLVVLLLAIVVSSMNVLVINRTITKSN